MSPERIAPEQFGFKNNRPTISSDCYALGMVIYETISGNVPFHKDADPTVFMKVVVKGEHPPRGVKFVKSLWGMLEQCWASKPNDRPSIEDVLRCMEMVSNSSEIASPGADGGVDEDGDWDSGTSSSGGDSPGFFATDDNSQFPPSHPSQEDYFNYVTEQKGKSPEATSVPHGGRLPPPGRYYYPAPPPHPQTLHTHTVHPPRSPSPTQSSASRVGMYPSPGQGAGIHSDQTHIFAPPITGAPPVRASNTSASVASSLSRGGGSAGKTRYCN